MKNKAKGKHKQPPPRSFTEVLQRQGQHLDCIEDKITVLSKNPDAGEIIHLKDSLLKVRGNLITLDRAFPGKLSEGDWLSKDERLKRGPLPPEITSDEHIQKICQQYRSLAAKAEKEISQIREIENDIRSDKQGQDREQILKSQKRTERATDLIVVLGITTIIITIDPSKINPFLAIAAGGIIVIGVGNTYGNDIVETFGNAKEFSLRQAEKIPLLRPLIKRLDKSDRPGMK